jgi:hypothetical protein
MLALCGGLERTLAEWRQLLAAAGFYLQAVHRGVAGCMLSIVEARPL